MSKTAIVLEEPYASVWKRGYLNTNSDGRKTLTLYNNHKDRSSTQYARYLMAVKLGRFLTKEEHVDHKDEDKTNDAIDNLQILTVLENNRKHFCKPRLICSCPICGLIFMSTKKKLGGKTQTTKCCSRKCGGKMAGISMRNKCSSTSTG